MPVTTNRRSPVHQSGFIPAILLLLSLLLAGCGEYQTSIDPEATVPPEFADVTAVAGDTVLEGVSVGDIVRNPEAYLGQTVKLKGQVNEALTEDSFRMSGGPLPLGDEILVIFADNTRGVTMIDGQPIQVTGVVSSAQEGDNQPVIIATYVISYDRG
jgi:hypothetical protein